MKYNVVSYFLREGFSNVFKNKKSTFACLGVMCATMLIFGLFFAIGENINHVVKKLEEEQTINVFILNGTTDEEIEKLGEKIRKINGINTVTFRTKEDAYNTVRKMFGDKDYVMDGRDPEMFSASYSVTLTDLKLNAEVKKGLEGLEHVKNVVSNDALLMKLSKVADWIRNVTIAILVILVIVSIFIISNTIKLTVHARRKEISIMKYIGATNGFIRTPFLIEGIVIGLIAGIISILLVGGIYNLVANKLVQSESETVQALNFEILSFTSLSTQVIVVYLILGIGIGVIGSLISMRKYLEV